MPDYPMSNYHFLVQWGGESIGFEEVSNLTMGLKVIEFREGSSPEYSKKKMPGQPYFDNFILRRAVVQGDSDFYKWFATCSLNTIERRDLIISVLSETHEPVLTWKAINCFPVRISWSDLNANECKVLIEEIEIACEGLSVLT